MVSNLCNYWMSKCTFINFHVSYDSATRFLRGGEKYYVYCVDNVSLFPTVKEFSKSVNIWWSYCRNSTPRFLRQGLYVKFCCAEMKRRRWRLVDDVRSYKDDVETGCVSTAGGGTECLHHSTKTRSSSSSSHHRSLSLIVVPGPLRVSTGRRRTVRLVRPDLTRRSRSGRPGVMRRLQLRHSRTGARWKWSELYLSSFLNSFHQFLGSNECSAVLNCIQSYISGSFSAPVYGNLSYDTNY